jgi:hypothetical protein
VPVPNMPEDLYRKLTPWQKRAYGASIIAAWAFIGYMVVFYQ